MDREFVRQQLLKLGHSPELLTDDLIDEFIEKIQEDEDLPPSPAKPKASPKKSPKMSPPKKSPSPKPKPVSTKLSSRRVEPSTDDDYSDDVEEPERSQSKVTRSPHRESPKRRARDDDDEEINGWLKRLKQIDNRARKLDEKIQECRSAIIDPPTDDITSDVPLYYGKAERKRDPYPTVKKSFAGGGGFIRPPPIRASRRPAGPGKAKGRRLLYEERFPDYVPGPEQRRDALRWKLRQKLAYSDPKYHQ